MKTIRTLLHPTDFSKQSLHAFELAVSLARDRACRLYVMYVATPPIVIYGDAIVPPLPPRDLSPLREKLRHLRVNEPSIQFEHRLVEGDAATEILRMAKEIDADMIVMGTHGRTGLVRALMGSVAEQVSRRAPCPVVTVNSPRQKKPRSGRRPQTAAAAHATLDPEC